MQLSRLRKWAPKLVGLFLFDLVWFSAVSGRADWLALTVLLVLVQVVVTMRTGPFSWRYFSVFVGLGLVLESSVVALGILRFEGGFLPIWLILLWLGFVAMLMNTLSGLAGRPIWAALLGIVSGPLTYAIGVRLGAAELLQQEWLMWVIYAALWAVYMVIFALTMPREQQEIHDA